MSKSSLAAKCLSCNVEGEALLRNMLIVTGLLVFVVVLVVPAAIVSFIRVRRWLLRHQNLNKEQI